MGNRARLLKMCAVVLILSAWSVAPAVLSAAEATAEPADAARAVFDATGVEGGLVVHVGCGDGRLTAALGGGDRYVAQGLDRDAENVALARQTIRAAGPYGEVSARPFQDWASLRRRLSYVLPTVRLHLPQEPLYRRRPPQQ